MKVLNIVYMILGAAVLTDFVGSFFYQEEVYNVLFWQTNVWVYRAYKLAFVLFILAYFIEKRRKKKLKS